MSENQHVEFVELDEARCMIQELEKNRLNSITYRGK